MKLRQIISEVKEKYKLDDYSDSFIFAEWNRAKNYIVGLKLRDQRYVPEWAHNTFCIELEEALSHDCGCITYGCTVWKSKYDVPETISLRATDTKRVRTLSGKIIGITTEEAIDTESTDYIKSKVLRATEKNGKILIWNVPKGEKLKAVQIEGVFQDITQWQGIQYCPDTENCPDVYDLEIRIPAELQHAIIMEMAKLLPGMLQRSQADVQEGNPEVGV